MREVTFLETASLRNQNPLRGNGFGSASAPWNSSCGMTYCTRTVHCWKDYKYSLIPSVCKLLVRT